MVALNSLVLYKSFCAIVTNVDSNGKYTIRYRTQEATATKAAVYSTQNVRSKDIILLHEEKVDSIENALKYANQCAPKEEELYNLENTNEIACQIKECWELLTSDESTASAPLSFTELAELFHGSMTSVQSYGLYLSLKNTINLNQSLKDSLEGKLIFIPRSKEEIENLVKKADEKGKEAEIRNAFLLRLKERKLLSDDSKYMVDVEALALGKTDKSRTLHDAQLKETPENAHKILLECGIWDITRNPYPIRWGLSMQSASESLASPPEEERLKVDHIAYAIDSEHSNDPDDAVAFDGKYLWVHIADPASSVLPDSSIDKAARARGSTLYLPEGAVRMLSESCLEDYALGLKKESNALSFRLLLDDEGNVEECCIFKTIVNVKRLTYKVAEEQKESKELKPLFDIARKNIEKRKASGAVFFQMPEVNIYLDENKKVFIEKNESLESNDMIREMMLLAGVGAAKFAFTNNIPFVYVSQDAPQPLEEKDIPEGLAGCVKLRKTMKKRKVSVTPGMHCGLGLNMYSQVTSPLRRYGDLLSHMQLRAFLDNRPLLDKDSMLLKISEGDEASQAANKASRKSELHWKLVYLIQNPEWKGKAVCVDKSQKIPLWSIPELAMETYMIPTGDVELNDEVEVRASNINISELTVDFIQI